MENLNFNDIFKSSILEKTSSFSVIDSLIGLLVAFVIGLFIYMVSLALHKYLLKTQ